MTLPKQLLLLILFATLISAGCTAVLATSPPADVSQAMMTVRPDFVLESGPAPGSESRLADFDQPADRPGPICLQLDGIPLAQPGERLFVDDLAPRLQLEVNGRTAQEIFRQEVSGLTIIETSAGETLVSGPFTFCWSIALSPGTHQATLTYHSPTGDVLPYNWSFSLTP